MKASILNPGRVRQITGSFAFIEHRFLKDGFFENLGKIELQLYLFLTLAGNRAGVSWYSYDRICSVLGIILDEYIDARNGLMQKDLIAFDGRLFQVLSLPESPVLPAPSPNASDMKYHGPDEMARLLAKAMGKNHEFFKK